MTDVATQVGSRRAQPAPRSVPGVLQWLPGVLLLIWTVVCLDVAGVDVLASTVFVVYTVLGLCLPGTLLWRALVARGARPWLEDVVLGTILAFAFQIVSYVVARGLDVPHLAPLWAVVVVLASLAHPRRGELWLSSATTAVPRWWAWSVAAIGVFVVAWLTRSAWLLTPVSGEGLRFTYADLPFHLALIADLRHHFPAEFPYVAGQPLEYHWFGHAEMAATSWGTGIPAIMLLERLSPLLWVALTVLGVGLLVRRLGGSWGGALLAVSLLGLVGNLNNNQNLYLSQLIFQSPTHTFGSVCSLLVISVMVVVLREVRVGAGPWFVFCVSALLISGAKATFVPVIAAGAVLVVLWRAWSSRAWDRRASAMTAVLGGSLVLASAVVYGRSAPGLVVAPFRSAVDNVAMVGLGDRPGVAWAVVAVLAYLVPNLVLLAGSLGLGRRTACSDPAAPLLVGCVLAGVGATYVFAHPDLSQFYFLLSTLVPAAALAGWGATTLLSEGWATRRPILVVLGLVSAAAGLGLASETARRQLSGAGVGVWALAPLVAVVVLVLVAGALATRVRGVLRPVAVMVVVGSLGLGLGQAGAFTTRTVLDPTATAWQEPPDDLQWTATLGEGGVRTARWLRQNTSPDDVLATDGHCRTAVVRSDCDRRAFSLAAFSERRFLVEGWSYTPPNAALASELDERACCIRFFDPALLAENDRAFDSPSRADVDRLRDRHGVRWLVVNRAQGNDWGALDEIAERRFKAGIYLVFEIR